MDKRRSYVDANVFIAAWRGESDIALQALAILDDPTRSLVVSDALWLELMPKAVYHQAHEERAFYETVFANAEHIPWKTDTLYNAYDLAQRYGVAAMDAIHLATALASGVDEFVSGEKPGKPMFRVRELNVRSLWSSRATS